MRTKPLYEPLTGRLRNAMAARCEKDKIAGMSLVLAEDTGPVLACSHGYADLFARTPFTENTLMGIASVSKLFTATGIMRLAEAGKLDIEQPVQTYIPEFSIKQREADAPPIRVIDLMTHHSGIPRDWLNHFYAYDPEPFTTVVGYLRDEYACRPAGEYYAYSNMAIALLGTVLQRVAGVPYEQYVTEEVLRPLGMDNSAFAQEYRNTALYAQAYDGLAVKAELPIRDKPGGGLHASAWELGHFMAAYLAQGQYNGYQLLMPETIGRMLSPQAEDAPMSFGKRMGLNWHLGRPALEYAGRVAHHGGALVYYRSELCILPDQGLGVAIVSNSSTATQAILELAEEALQEAVRIKTGLEPRQASVAFRRRDGVAEATPGGQYATSRGYVDIRPEGHDYAFRWNGRKLVLQGQADGTYLLHRRSEAGLQPDTRFASAPLRFCLDPRSGTKVLLIGMWPDGEAFTPEPVSPAWLSRLGEYRACNRMPEEALTDIPHALGLKVKRGILHLEVIGPGYRYERVLQAEGDAQALRLGWGQEERTTVYVKEATEGEMLWHMGIAFRKVEG